MGSSDVPEKGEKKLYLVIDVESTCWEAGDDRIAEPEIIEIGAVLYDEKQKKSLQEFQSFVKPVRIPWLSDFCISLTSIRQRQVDTAPEFPAVLQKLKEKMIDPYSNPLFSSWGEYDCRQFKKDCRYHHIEYPFGDEHLNIKQHFADKMSCRPCGMDRAMAILGLDLKGTHHRAIDDARNIATILDCLLHGRGQRDKHFY